MSNGPGRFCTWSDWALLLRRRDTSARYLSVGAMISRCDLLCNLSPRAWSCRFVVLTARCLAKTPTASLIARVGCGRGLLYAWVSLSHASLLVVGIRACKVMGETRFAGSVFTRQNNLDADQSNALFFLICETCADAVRCCHHECAVTR